MYFYFHHLQISLLKLYSKIKLIIKKTRVARLSTVDKTSQPYSIPVVFVYYKNSFFIPLDEKTKSTKTSKLRRVKNIEHNPQVCLLIDEYTENWNDLFYILIKGKAELIHEKYNLKHVHKLLVSKYPQYMKIGIGDSCIRINPTKVTIWNNESL